MEKIKFRCEEVLAFLEDSIIHGEADEDEMELYECWTWSNTFELNGHTNTYKLVLKRMHNEYNGK